MNKFKVLLVALLTVVGASTLALTISNSIILASVFDGNTVFQNVPVKLTQAEVCGILQVRLHGQPESSYFYKIFTEDYNRTCSQPWEGDDSMNFHASAPEETEYVPNQPERPLNHK